MKGTNKFKFLLLRIEGNVQPLDIFLVLLSPLVQLGHRHLFGRALLLEFVNLSPEFGDLLVQRRDTALEGLDKNIRPRLFGNEALQMSARFCLTGDEVRKLAGLFVDLASTLLFESPNRSAKLFIVSL